MSIPIALKQKSSHLLKRIIGLAVALLFLEFLSAALLLTIAKPEQQHFTEQYQLMDRFPAQFRMNGDEIRKEFPRALPMQRTGGYLTFPFDPVLGFQVTDNLEWYGGSLDDRKNKFFIITFGGSTTVGDNWPKYLRQYAELEGVAQDLLILNAGHMGYMTFNEQIYFSDWILPMLEKNGVKPDLVLTLDGINDVWTRIFSYNEKKTQNSPVWFSHYHGYHQHLDTDMRKLNQPRAQFGQMVSVLAMQLYDFSVNHLSRVIPYTLKAGLAMMRKKIQHLPSPSEIRTFGSANVMTLEENVENTIVNSYHDTLLNFHGVAAIRNIPFVAYLQPVLLDKYYPYDASKHLYYPNINYFSLNLYRVARQFTRLGGDYIVKSERLYDKVEKMYRHLGEQYKGNYSNIMGVLHDLPDVPHVYNNDAIHYEIQGKERIAHVIVQDLLSRGLLAKK